MLKLGIIGMGTIYEHQRAAIERLNDFRITCACDKKIAEPAEMIDGMRLYADWREMLRGDCECVLISLPVQLHYEAACAALRAGKHVLLEKPMVLSAEQLDEMYDLARRNHVLLHGAYHAAFAADLEWFLENRDELVRLHGRAVRADMSFFDPYMAPALAPDRADALGDSWIDSGINALSVAARLFDLEGAQTVYADHRKTQGVVTAMRCGWRLAAAAGGTELNIHTDWSNGQNLKKSVLLFEDGAQITIHHSGQRVECDGRILYAFDECPRLIRQYEGVLDDFSHALKLGCQNETQSRMIHQMLFNVRESYTE